MTPRIRHPRAVGLVLFVAGVVLDLMNWHELTHEGGYWFIGILLGPFATMFGLWRVCIGQPWDDKANRMKRWASVGDAIAIVSGLAISGVIIAWLYQQGDRGNAIALIVALAVGALAALYTRLRAR